MKKIKAWLRKWLKEDDDESAEILEELSELVNNGYRDFLRKTCEDMTEEGLSRSQIESAIEKMKVDIKTVEDADGHMSIEFSWKEL